MAVSDEYKKFHKIDTCWPHNLATDSGSAMTNSPSWQPEPNDHRIIFLKYGRLD
jgi:hypothetical protein